jgi:tRNA pseudouridine55 synthase
MPDIAPRPVTIHELVLVAANADEATFEARCGKGTYVRAIARDLGRLLGCYGHVCALRRTRVGPFMESDAVALAQIEDAAAPEAMRRVEAGLLEVQQVVVDRDSAARLRRGQSILLRGRDAPGDGAAYASCGGVVVAIGAIERGELVPGRVFNLPF